MEKENISQFYDEFSKKQTKTGINERLISLFKRMQKWGLAEHSSVLELGCGVGAFAHLLAQKIKSGRVEAVDLSGKSIEIAQKSVQKKNIQFSVGDVVHYKPQQPDFDFITLLDVIEHIPLDEHSNLFQNISEIASEKTLLIINIPNPDYITYLHKHHPEGLQVIDQAIELPLLAENLEKNNLEIVFFEKYGIWEKEDYHFFIIRKKRDFVLRHLSDERTLWQKFIHKMGFKKDLLKFS